MTVKRNYQIEKKNGYFRITQENGALLTMAQEKFKEEDGFCFKNLSGREKLLPVSPLYGSARNTH